MTAKAQESGPYVAGSRGYFNALIHPVSHGDWAQDERSMTVDQIRQYMAHYFANKQPRLVEPFVAIRMAVGRGPEFERWVQSSAAANDMLLNEPVVDFVASLSTPTLFVCGLSDRTYVGAKYTAPANQGAKGNIAEMTKGFAAKMPKTHFVGVPDTGHVPHLESPAAFSSAVVEFLRLNAQ
jgi:pimeloyl-ACP methyl ester carboxylesterase